MLNIQSIRADFPILNQQINGKDLVYFDNAATTQKPTQVIEAISHYYNFDNANIHRGIHTLAERATRDFEASRIAIKEFLNASSIEEIIFTSGTTQGINLVASSFGRKFIKEGDEILHLKIKGTSHKQVAELLREISAFAARAEKATNAPIDWPNLIISNSEIKGYFGIHNQN